MKKPAKNGASSPVAHAENSGNAVRKSRRAVRKQAQKRPNVLPNGMERLRATIEASVDCIITIDANSTLLEFNGAAERVFGYAREEVIGKPLTETIIPPSLREAHLKGMAALVKRGPGKLLGRRVEMPAMRADGSEFPVELTITQIASENPPLFTAYLRDITERKRAEEELSNSLALLRAITEGTTDAVFAKDRQGRYIMANTATAHFVGKSSEEVTGLDDTALFSAETAARIMERDRSVMESGETRTDEDVSTTAEGVFRAYLTTKGPLRDSSGAINGVFGIARDITERKRAEETLRQADERIRIVIDTIPTLAWSLQPDGRLDFVNQRWLEYTGLSLPDAIEDSKRIVHPEDLARAVEKWQPAMAAGYSHEDEIRLRRADGEYRWFLVRISPLRDAAGNVVNWYGAAVDIEDRKQAEMQVRTLIDAIPHQIWSGPADGTLDYCNERWRSYMGLELEDLCGDGWQSMLHPEDRERVLKAWGESVSNGTPYEQEERHRGADGTYRWFLARGVPMRDAEGRIVRWYGTNTDIEDHKRAEEALRKSDKLFSAFMDHLPGFAWMKDLEGRYVYANKKELELDVYRTGALGKTDAEVWPAEIAAAYRANDRQVITTKRALQTVEPSLASGPQSYMLVSKFPIFDPDGSVVLVAGAGVDITDLTEAKDALNAQALRYKTLMETSTDSIYVVDENGDLQEANAAFRRRRGYTVADLKGLNIADWDAQWDREQIRKRIRKLGDGSSIFETRHRSKDGSIFDVEICVTSVRINADRLLFCVARDITERKRAEERLREYERVVEGLEEMIVVVDRDYRYLLANRAFLNFRGLEREQLIGRRAPEVLGPEAFAGVAGKLSECLAGKTIQYEMRYRFPDNSERDLLVSYFPIEGPGGIDRVACILKDITGRKKSEAALSESEARFRQIAENIEEVFWITDVTGTRPIYISPAYERITGRSCESLYSAPKSWRDDIHPEDRPRMEATFASDPGSTGDYTYRIVRPDGTLRWIRDRGFPVRDENGEVVRFAGIAEDITSQKQAEEALRESEQQMRLFMEATADCLWKWDLITGNVVRSVGFHRLFGYATEEVDSSITWWEERLHPDDRAKVLSTFHDTVARGGNACSYEYRFRRKDGSLAVIQDHACIVRDARGRPLCALGAMTDITERRQAEDRLRRSEEKFKTLFAIAPVGIAFLDSRLNIVDCNPALERMSRLSREELLGQAWRRRTFLNADGSPRLPGERISERAVKEKLPLNGVETGAVMESGDIVWAEVNVAPLTLPDASAVVIMQDITERKQTEQAQERALSLMLATLECTADGILVVNTEGKIVTFNRLFARMWRLPDEVLASKEDARALECVLDQLVEPEKFIEKVSYLYGHPEEESFDQLVFKDGRVFERYSRPQLIGGNVAGRVWSFRDITERNQGREALQKANRQLRSLSRRLFQVQEQEKRHLARELHDEIGQTLTAVKINLTSLGTANGDHSLRLEETIALLDNLLRQVRQISLDLHPSLLDDLGLAAALRSLLDQQARRAGLRAQFCAAQLTDNIDVAISSTAFRITQEAITNVLRHAKASFIKVQLQTEAGRLRIEVADDGAGFDVAEARQRGHQEAGFGLMGMKERAALVGGEVEVTSARGTGTRVQISLPLKENGSTP